METDDKCTTCNGTGYVPCKDCICPICNGKGKAACPKCKDGYQSCFYCNSTGQVSKKTFLSQSFVPCPECKGAKKIRCLYCEGSSFISCAECDGTGKILTCLTCNGTRKVLCDHCKGTGRKENGILEQKISRKDILVGKTTEMIKIMIDHGRNPDNLSTVLKLNDVGRKYEEEGQLDNAIDEYRKAIELVPECVDPHLNLAIVYDKKGMNEEALKEYDKVKEIFPDWPYLHYNLGIHYRNIRLYEEAIKAFRKELDLYGDEYNINVSLGGVYLTKALEINKEDNKKDQHEPIAILLEQSITELKTAFKFDQGDLAIKQLFNKACLQLDIIKPGRFQEIGVDLSLSRINGRYFSNDLEEKPGEWSSQIEFAFPRITKSIVVNSCFSDKENIQWIYADLLGSEKIDSLEYSKSDIIGHLIMNSNGIYSVFAYDQHGKSILNPDEETSRDLNRIATKYFYYGNPSLKQLSIRISKAAYKAAKRDNDRMACAFNVGYCMLFSSTNINLGERFKPEHFESVPSSDINEAGVYFNNAISIYKQMSPPEQSEMEAIYKQAKDLSSISLALILGRPDC